MHSSSDDQINAYNIRTTGIDDWRGRAVFVRDDAVRNVAGIDGGTWGGNLEVKHLWVAEPLRGQGYGARLLAAAEGEAAARGCTQMLLDTHHFQAIGFYRRYGYEVFGTFENIGGRHTRYYLRKRLL
jgi:GNAT superfamily N-acetyltransferase